MRLCTGAGPKHYPYDLKEISTGKLDHVIKIGGSTLNHRSRQEITFKDMYDVVWGRYKSKQIFTPNNILRKANFRVVYKAQTKQHTVVQQRKRRELNFVSTKHYLSVPFGFRGSIKNMILLYISSIHLSHRHGYCKHEL